MRYCLLPKEQGEKGGEIKLTEIEFKPIIAENLHEDEGCVAYSECQDIEKNLKRVAPVASCSTQQKLRRNISVLVPGWLMHSELSYCRKGLYQRDCNAHILFWWFISKTAGLEKPWSSHESVPPVHEYRNNVMQSSSLQEVMKKVLLSSEKVVLESIPSLSVATGWLPSESPRPHVSLSYKAWETHQGSVVWIVRICPRSGLRWGMVDVRFRTFQEDSGSLVQSTLPKEGLMHPNWCGRDIKFIPGNP